MPLISEALARSFAHDLLRGMKAKPAHVEIVGDHLVNANLAGHDSHGLVRLPQYHAQLVNGKIDVKAEPKVEVDSGAFVLLSSEQSWGQVGAAAATRTAIARAEQFGFSCVGLRSSPHIGRVGVYPLAASKAGYVAQAWCNCGGAARVAPWGGTDARLATNPIALSFPSHDEPILVDITTSVVAEGKVRIAKNAGKDVPVGWILDKNGQSTTNPADLYEGGTILPLGGEAFGHKGFALAMMADLFAGVLINSGCGLMPGIPLCNGLLLIVIDPSKFGNRDEVLDRLTAYADYLRQSKTKPGTDEILLPGEPERRTEEKRRREGIPVDDGTWKQLIQLAEKLRVAAPTLS